MREIGRMLKEVRLARGLEIHDMAKRTCITEHYLRAIEDGKFHCIPNVFDKGYLKIYAAVLEIDPKPVLALYEQKKKQATNDRSGSNAPHAAVM